jgi:hypothetical protein
MFDKLADFDPACWQENGVVSAPLRRDVSVEATPLRRAPWTVSFSLLLSLGATSLLTVQPRESSDAGVAIFATADESVTDLPARLAVDPDYVQPQFWGRVERYLETLPRTVDSNDSADPEPFV